MLPKLKNGVITDERLEELLFNLRPGEPEEPMHPRVDDLKRRRVISAVLAQWEDSSTVTTEKPAARLKIRLAIVGAAAGFVVLIAGVYFASTFADKSLSSDTISTTSLASSEIAGDKQLVPQSRFSLLHGDVSCGDTAVKLGGSVPLGQWIETDRGQSAFALPTGIAVGLAEYSAARVFWNGNRRYEVEINQGMALFSVDPAKAREGFYVRTPQGVIQVTGTLFSVAIQEKGNVEVSLLRGKVELQPPNQPVAYVEAGQSAIWRSDSVKVEPATKTLQDVSPLYRLGCFDGGQTFSELTERECDSIDAAVSDHDTTGNHSRKSSGIQNWRSKSAVATADPTNSLAQLLHAVSQARRENDWGEVAALYRQIVRDYPGTSDARTALVSLAQVELNRLNNPKAALGHFNAYLRSPGSLEPEALYGKAKAYRLTNNDTAEVKTLKKLVAKYPTGPISLAAEKRLRELSSL